MAPTGTLSLMLLMVSAHPMGPNMEPAYSSPWINGETAMSAPMETMPGESYSSSYYEGSSMLPHLAYFPALHGYYYFRPYSLRHLQQHQAAVVRWGGDPRNPYANVIFERLDDGFQTDPARVPAEEIPTPNPYNPAPNYYPTLQ